ncbi:aspartate-semialdehyde dehydrogenase [Novispirillum itersonii]|uniref:Aspartate-semialdehyde dehydrogenase n=1 Tax=Novispirillum itersonii TaxID=189 RepID=A0A7W9ZEE6_NOVIT|nr:aspartate-semialdehyde dehydrogenase [Novispirillum itersonii]MBB6209082.1 aspartate-semialdehyde dehydrogenase [Novispirillum itersonii]
MTAFPTDCRIALVGAASHLGQELLSVLAEQGIPVEQLVALGPAGTVGREFSYGEDDDVSLQNMDTFDFSTVSLVILADTAAVAVKVGPRAVKAGARVIDASGHYSTEPGVPMVVAGVNSDDLDAVERKRVVSAPTASAVQAVLALAPLYDSFQASRAVITAFHSTADAGREGMDELFRQTRGIYVNEPPASNKEIFAKQIAFNVIPQVGGFAEGGATDDELAVALAVRKALDPDLRVHVTAARVAAFVGLGQYVTVECDRPVTDKEAREVLRQADGLSVVDHRVDEGMVTMAETSGEERVFLSRLRSDLSVDSGVSFWSVSDGTRLQALNIWQIAVLLTGGTVSWGALPVAEDDGDEDGDE